MSLKKTIIVGLVELHNIKFEFKKKKILISRSIICDYDEKFVFDDDQTIDINIMHDIFIKIKLTDFEYLVPYKVEFYINGRKRKYFFDLTLDEMKKKYPKYKFPDFNNH